MSQDGSLGHVAALQRSQVLAAQGRADEALAVIDEALGQLPEDPLLLQQRGWVLIRLDRHSAAVQSLRAALAVTPDDTGAQHLLSIALTELGELAGAREAVESCLAAEPENPEHHLQLAVVLAKSRRLIGRGALTREAIAHLEKAISLDPERVSSYAQAARVYALLGKSDIAVDHVQKGLTLAPDDLTLLAAHTDLAAPAPTNRYDHVTGPAHRLQGVARVLSSSPQHLGARRVLFDEIWYRQTLLLEMPLSLAPLLALAAGLSFTSSGDGGLVALTVFAIAIAFLAGMRLGTHALVTRHASASYRRMLSREGPAAAVRRWISWASWGLTALAGLGLLFVRDAVVVRWMLVALGAAVLLSLVAAVLQHLAFPASARRVASFVDDPRALEHLAARRATLRQQIVFRSLFAFALTVMSQAVQIGRADAGPVLMLGAAAVLLSPLVGLLTVRAVERGVRQAVDAASETPSDYRRPGIIGLVVTVVVASLVTMQVAVSAASLPFMPNEHDAVGTYRLTWADDDGRTDGGRTDDDCTGRPASRVACVLEKQEQMREKFEDMPIPTFTPIEIPTIPVIPPVTPMPTP